MTLRKKERKENYRDSSIFFSFFPPSAAWLGFTASAPAVVYHGWPTMLQRSASGLSEEEEEKEEEVEKEEEGESGFSSSPPDSLLPHSLAKTPRRRLHHH